MTVCFAAGDGFNGAHADFHFKPRLIELTVMNATQCIRHGGRTVDDEIRD